MLPGSYRIALRLPPAGFLHFPNASQYRRSYRALYTPAAQAPRRAPLPPRYPRPAACGYSRVRR